MERPGICAAPGEELALSLSQREVWLDQRAWPDSSHLNIGGGAFLVGALDVPRLQRALSQLVAQSEALRLVPSITGRQYLLAHFEPTLEIIELGAQTNPREAMRQWWQARIREPFTLGKAPPWRFSLLRAGTALHGLTIQFHHLVMDGWGTVLVMQRWSALYTAMAPGAAASPPDRPQAADYRSFIQESNAYRHSEAFARDELYWQGELPSLPQPLMARRYTPVSRQQLPPSCIATHPVRQSAYAQLRSVAAARGDTPFNYLLTAVLLYFARTCGYRELVIGVPSLNRNGHQHRHTPGMFVGVLVLRVMVTPDMTLRQLSCAAGQALRRALRHARYPLSELGRHLGAIRAGRDSLFDVMLSFERQDYALSFGEATLVDSRQLFSGSARYPLGITACEFAAEQHLELVLDGSSACFAEGEVALLGRRLWHLVEVAMTQPERTVQEIDLLPAEERWALLRGLHQDVACHAQPRAFITLFEHQAALRPEATALVWDGGSMDYQQLDRQANELAARLMQLGAATETIVALALPRGARMVSAILAIAKTGAAFLPLDPDAPQARLAQMLQDSQALVLLVAGENTARFQALHHRLLAVDASISLETDPSPGRALSNPKPSDLAYVLFTSGSAGQPKGVMVEHGALSRRLAWLSRSYGVDWRDRSSQATQITFDPALIELLLPLTHGASVALPPPGRLAAAALLACARQHEVTIMAFVPSTLAGFLDAAQGCNDLKLRVACCGGEVLSAELANRFAAQTGAQLFNVYGPTEAVIFASAWKCDVQPGGTNLPVGRPIDDTRIYVLDDQLRAQPFGVAGDIFLGGATLARGYLNRPELDRSVFLDDPFEPGGRIYRTGDRGWLGADGNLNFIGRTDRQVKLRGYRIELGEIERACLAVSGVNQAAAKLMTGDTKAQLWLWASLSAELSTAELGRALRLSLPDYMLPASIVVLPALKQLVNGKLDYDALQVPLAEAPARPLQPPRNPLEHTLLTMWRRALKTDALGTEEDFFELGGDSLAAVQILTDIEAQLGRTVPLHVLTEHPSVAQLAAVLTEQAAASPLLVELSANSEDERACLCIAASGHGDLLRLQSLAKALGHGYRVCMLQPPAQSSGLSMLGLATLYADCLRERHIDRCFIAGFSVGGVVALETARLLRQRNAVVHGLILIDTLYPWQALRGSASWRAMMWLVRHLHLQELSLNGRRLGTLFNDVGLVTQVMALRGYQPTPFDGPATLLKSSGLVKWDRWLFRPWRRLIGAHLHECQVPGLHGSIFEAAHIDELARAMRPHLCAAPSKD